MCHVSHSARTTVHGRSEVSPAHITPYSTKLPTRVTIHISVGLHSTFGSRLCMRSRQYGKGSTCAASRPFSPSSRPEAERVASSARADPPPPAASTDGTGGRAPPPREKALLNALREKLGLQLAIPGQCGPGCLAYQDILGPETKISCPDQEQDNRYLPYQVKRSWSDLRTQDTSPTKISCQNSSYLDP
jgi:hypothetical protein